MSIQFSIIYIDKYERNIEIESVHKCMRVFCVCQDLHTNTWTDGYKQVRCSAVQRKRFIRTV